MQCLESPILMGEFWPTQIVEPIASMGLVYLPSFTIDISTKCRQYMEIHGWYGEFRLQGCTSNVVEKPTLGPPCQRTRPACCANSGRPEKDLPNGCGYQHKHVQRGRRDTPPKFNKSKVVSSLPSINFQGQKQ